MIRILVGSALFGAFAIGLGLIGLFAGGSDSLDAYLVLAMLLFASSGFDPEAPAANNRIVVGVEERDGQVVVEVSDNGRELTEAEAQHVFDPFFRSTVLGSGVGVGLSVARSVATTTRRWRASRRRPRVTTSPRVWRR